MKFALSTVMFLSFISLARAWEPVETKMACNDTESAFADFKSRGFEPVIVGQSQKDMFTVWMSPEDKVLVTRSISSNGTSITCIVAGAEAGSATIERLRFKRESGQAPAKTLEAEFDNR